MFDPWNMAPDLVIDGLDELPTEFARRQSRTQTKVRLLTGIG